MNNKPLLGISVLLLAMTGLGVYSLINVNLLQQQIAGYEQIVEQLQGELESSADAQVNYETELNGLQRQLNNRDSRLSVLENELTVALQQVDPDVAQLEQQIRERVIMELQQSPQQTLSRMALFKQLTSLDPQEMSQLMTLQGTYGGFLQELSPGDERMEELVDGFSNIISERNQQRMNILEEIRGNPDRIDEIRSQMMATNGPEAQMEALSYLLTPQELEIYQQYRLNQAQSGVSQTATFAIRQDAANGAVLLNESGTVSLQQGQGSTGGIQIITREQRPN